MATNVAKDVTATDTWQAKTEERKAIAEDVKRAAYEIRALLEPVTGEHTLACYKVGAKVRDLDKRYGRKTIGKLAQELDLAGSTLRKYARVAEIWTEDEFTKLATQKKNKGGLLGVWEFHQLARVIDASARERLRVQALEESWSVRDLKQEVTKQIGNLSAATERPTNVQERAHAAAGTAVDALSAIIMNKQARLTELAHLREVLAELGEIPEALASSLREALACARALRNAYQETEQLLEAVLQSPVVEQAGEISPSVWRDVPAAHEVVRGEVGRPVARLAVVGEQPHGDSLEIGGDVLPVRARARDGPEDRRDVARRPGWETPVREQFPEHDPDRVQIGPAVEFPAFTLLG